MRKQAQRGKKIFIKVTYVVCLNNFMPIVGTSGRRKKRGSCFSILRKGQWNGIVVGRENEHEYITLRKILRYWAGRKEP